MTIKEMLDQSVAELGQLLQRLGPLEAPLRRLGEAMMRSWAGGGKVLVAGNGGSAADAMHLAEELVVRFQKHRRGLAALALCDGTVVTCAGNDMGYESVFSRQVEALGNRGDVFIGLSTSGNSPNILRAFEAARAGGVVTAGFLGKYGGRARALCDIELLVPSPVTARVQEVHKLLFHTLCQWVDSQVD